MKQDLISVIIPIYKMEKFIEKCLRSICNSTYKNLEIICVDDGSPDSSMDIVKNFKLKDSRIKIVTNPQNLGLFRARVEGMKASNGDYICFVDADDFVSIDWFRLLHNKIAEESADMVIGNTVNVDENLHYYYYNNYRSLTLSHKTLYEENILKTFLNQEGACFLWHTVWNKLYSRSLIKECMPYFENLKVHLVMGEDIAFSSVFYTHAKKLAFVNADAYFYYRHSEASTSTSLPLDKILKNIEDLKIVFDFFENSIKSYNLNIYNQNRTLIQNFKNRYHRIWSGNLYNKNATNDKHSLQILKNTFGTDEIILPRPHDFYFYELTTNWSNRFENIKKQIQWSKIKVVSFDIFDTLIKRALYNPQDIFYFVGKYAKNLLPFLNEKSFFELRILAEEKAREKLKHEKPMFEDVTLTEIYDTFANILNIDKSISLKIMEEENRLEMKLCQSREAIKELFELAKYCDKKIVLVSDMYLEKPIIEQILYKNGYKGYEKLYLSSDYRCLKSTGKLFDILIKELGCNKDEIVHIGDNWNTDIITAGSKGIQTIFIPKAIETFENKISDIYSGSDLGFYLQKKLNVINETDMINDLNVRCMIALSANKIFDNPFSPFQIESNYNADTYLTGYYTLGMHLVGVAKWIIDIAQEKGYKKVVFLARDGFVIKKVFDIICNKMNVKIKTEYAHVSRKALIPFSIKDEKDLYTLYDYMDIKEHSPNSILKLLYPILSPMTNEKENQYFKNGIILDNKFRNNAEYLKFVDNLIKISFDKDLLKENRELTKKYFKEIFTDKSATFDIGYSGRLQNIINDFAEKQIDAFFIHSNGYSTQMIANNKFNVHCFYNFNPTITSIVREFFISKMEPSCVGYSQKDQNLFPIFEDKKFNYEETYAINEFQKGAIDFCRDYSSIFDSYISELKSKNIMASLPFERYLLFASQFDRYAFSSALVEDEVYGGYDNKSLFDIWTWHINNCVTNYNIVSNNNNINTLDVVSKYISKFSRFKRALFYWLYDRKTFKIKLKNHFEKRKQTKIRRKNGK